MWMLADIAGAQVLLERFKLVPSDGAPFDRFGRDVALQGDLGLIGAPLDDDRGDAAGAAYTFDLRTGQQIDKLLARDPPTGEIFGQADDNFGDALALAGDFAVLGALQKEEAGVFSGAAYSFDAGRGRQLERLLPFSPPPFSPAGSAFGASVALSPAGERLVIGAPGDTGTNEAGANGGGGAAYLYDNQAQRVVKVFASDAQFAANFGTAVAVSSAVAAVGAPFEDVGSTDTGAVYLFDSATGAELAKVVAPASTANDLFGFSLAMTDAVIAIGAPFENNERGSDAGAVYLFDALSYALLRKLVPAEDAPGELFGFDVAIDGDRLAVGGDEVVSVFDVPTGALVAELLPSDPAPAQFFGASLAIDGSTVLVGAEGDEANGERSGAAYVYDLTALDPPARVSVASVSADVFARGTRRGARVTVAVTDAGGAPVADAQVRLAIRGDIAEFAVGTTGADGAVTVRSRQVAVAPLEYFACVIGVVAEVAYAPQENAQTCALRRQQP